MAVHARTAKLTAVPDTCWEISIPPDVDRSANRAILKPMGRPRGRPGVAGADGAAAAVAANNSIQREARDAEVSEKSAVRTALPSCGVPIEGTAGCCETYRERPGVKLRLDQLLAAWSGVCCQPMGTQNRNLSLKEER